MITDLNARLEALNPEQSFIVQAPAGSGKTGLLVYRYLSLLARVDKPQNILAITFTRKARAEMRERILELMHAAHAGAVADDPFEQQGIDLAKKALQRDADAHWALLKAPQQLQILTIDSFSARLAGSMPWLSRLGDRPNTTDQADVHYAAAVEAVLDELLHEESDLLPALKIVMHELDFNYDKARRLFASMLARRDQWLRHLVPQNLTQMRESLEQAWYELNVQSLAKVEELFPSQMLTDLLELAVQAAPRINFDGRNSVKEMQAFINHSGSVDDLGLQEWQALANFLMVKTDAKVRAAPNVNTGFPAKHKDKERCKQLFDELREDHALLAELDELRQLPQSEFNDDDWACLVALEQVLKALAVRLQLQFRNAGECDHSEVTQRANMALSEQNNPTDLGLMMDGQIQHILVDEFQDTSHGQLALLKKLTAGWQLNESPAKTLFLVGDPMQSIYRFREADVSLFLQVADNQHSRVFDNIAIRPLTLSQNFRSSETLVEWFNQTFSRSFPASDGVLTGAIRYAQANSNKQDDNREPVRYALAYDNQQEATTLLEEVKQALQHLPEDEGQVAILVRTRPQLDYLLPLLDQHQIAYTAIDIQPLHVQQAIQDAVALCHAICRDEDRLAWLALLRGPWVGLSLAQLKLFATPFEQSIWQNVQDPDKQAGLDPQSAQRLRRFVGIMNASKQQYQQVDLGSLTRWAWRQLGGEHTLGVSQLRDVEQLFDVLNKVQRGADLPSQKELQQAISSMRARAPQAEQARVVVSTIHKSKGLQYHTVILPGLANPPKSDDREVLMWAEYQQNDGDASLLMAPLRFTAELGSHYDYLRKLDGQRANNEVMRLMYVAATRAEKKLVLISKAKLNKDEEILAPRKNTLLASVWSVLEDQFGLPERPEQRAESSAQHMVTNSQENSDLLLDQTLHRLPADYQAPIVHDFAWQALAQLNTEDALAADELVSFDWATEVATAVGVVLHHLLQFSGAEILRLQVDENLKRRWRAELLALRVPDERMSYALQRLVTAVENIQIDQQAHFIFQDYPVAQNEYAVSTLENGVVKKYRLDRTFVDADNVRWVVDYKSTVTKSDNIAAFVAEQIAERHQPQLEKYGELISKIDNRPIKLAVYFPLLKHLHTWDYKVPCTDMSN